MSHGGGDDSIEPDLTPLLDLVMQLLMFFIVSVRVVKEQTHQHIQLPVSSSADLVKKADLETLFINQKNNRGGKYSRKLDQPERDRLERSDSVILVKGRAAMDPLDTRIWLTDLYNKAKKEAEAEKERTGKGTGEVRTIIHFRADGDLELSELFKVMNIVKTVGYTKLKIRAIRKNRG